MKQRKLVPGCRDCDKIRMKPVKAFAVVSGNTLMGNVGLGKEIIMVHPNKKTAKKYWRPSYDRIAKVEIREVE